MEHCKNPLKPECHNENILLYMQINQEKLPICQQCWNAIAETTYEWGEDTLMEKEKSRPN